ncbi:hypothetical protein F4781DRAFT_401322 [Annulohypoxylon bovei var. microspora]|nr:hypothetical protein F4781DRAFT_401322 [Annulohypoxylon bovei var. microspora]
MDEDSIDTQAWRRSRLGDEPIYCAAPSPSNPDDIICLGSDEELDDDAKMAKRLRYETQGLRYLQGKPIRIFSSSLHGPFDKASGWNNPWLPKQPAVKNPVLKPSQPTAKPFLAIKERFRKYLGHDDTTPGTSNSIRCHLPSPESNRELQLSGSPPEPDKRNRIQDWANEVSRGAVLEKDAFWAPNQVHPKETDMSSQKRPAGKDWLKKQSKRKRLNTSQDMITASTPTPIPSTQTSTRCSSVPTNIGQTLKPIIPRNIASQSFELATPSSTANQSDIEAPYRGQYDTSIIPSQVNTSNISEATVQNSKMRYMNNVDDRMYNQPSPAVDQKHGWDSNAATEDYAKQACEYLRNEQVHQSQKTDGSDFESYIDQSFHYRTRPTKQAMDIEGPTTNAYPEPTQTRTPSSPVHEDAVPIAVQEIEKPPQPPCSSPGFEQQVLMEHADINQEPKSSPDETCHREEVDSIENRNEFLMPPRSKVGAPEDHKPPIENPKSTRSDSVNVLISPEITNALHIESKVIRNNGPSPVQDDPHIPRELCEENVAQNATLSKDLAEVKTNPTENQLIVDEESTIIGDPMDIDESTLYETNRVSTIHRLLNSPTPEVMPTVEPHEPTEITMKGANQDETDTESNSVVVPRPQPEWEVSKVSSKSTVELGVVYEDEMSILDVKVEQLLDKDDPTQATLLEPPEINPPQSPWIIELPPGSTLTVGHIKSEPIDDVPSPSPCPSHLTLLSSQASDHGTSRTRPSQQSPWSEGLLEPARIEKREHHLTGAEAMPMDIHFITTSQIHQSPRAESNISIMPHPKCSPLSPAPVVSNKKPLQPHLQIPMAAVGLDKRYPEPSKEDPITPPRRPTYHVQTPDLEKSIKSFAMFDSPSPKRQIQQSFKQSSSIRHSRGILSSAAYSNPRNSGRSTRRVTFAIFSDEGDDTETQQPPIVGRAASPPPQTTIDVEDEDVGEAFQKHFDIMKRRASGENVQFRLQSRLLPSSSQQVPISPTVGAMAEAFQKADAYIPNAHGSPIGGAEEKDVDQEMPDREQSPWRKESQGVDDVADIMNNLDDFLNTWDVETELQKAKQEPSRGGPWDMVE